MNKRPSLLKIMAVDYVSFNAWFAPAMMWIVYLALLAFGDAALRDEALPVVMFIVSIGGPLALAWRLWWFHSIFNAGIQSKATIEDVFFYRSRGRVIYRFTFEGRDYSGSETVRRTAQTRALETGQKVIVMLDPRAPKRSFIKELYCDA